MFVFGKPDESRFGHPAKITAEGGTNTPSRAFAEHDAVTLSLFVSRAVCAYGASLLLYDGKETGTPPVLSRQSAIYQGLKDGYDVYSLTVTPNIGLYFFVFEILTAYGIRYTSEEQPGIACLCEHPDHGIKSQFLVNLSRNRFAS